MSNRIEKAINELADAVSGEAKDAMLKAKDLGLPVFAGLAAQFVGAISAVQLNKESTATESEDLASGSEGDSLSLAKIKAIKALIAIGQSDEDIAEATNVTVDAVRTLR